jgi:hypothetical protein
VRETKLIQRLGDRLQKWLLLQIRAKTTTAFAASSRRNARADTGPIRRLTWDVFSMMGKGKTTVVLEEAVKYVLAIPEN